MTKMDGVQSMARDLHPVWITGNKKGNMRAEREKEKVS